MSGPKKSPLDKLRFIEFLAANGVTGNELRAMILFLELYNNDQGDAWPSYNTIARCLGISRRKAIDIVASLVRKRYLEVDPATGGTWISNRYVPRWDSVEPDSSFMALARRKTGDARVTTSGDARVTSSDSKLVTLDAQTGDPECTKLVTPGSPKPSEEPYRGTLSPPTAGERSKRSPQAGESAATRGSGDTPETPDPASPVETAPDRVEGSGGGSLDAHHRPPPLVGQPETNHDTRYPGLPLYRPKPTALEELRRTLAAEGEAEPLAGQPTPATMRDIAAARFDLWDDCAYPGLPPIHAARDSQYQHEQDVAAAWFAALERAAAIVGSQLVALELYRTCQQTKAEQILAKAAEAKHPANYVATAMRNHKLAKAKARANGAAA